MSRATPSAAQAAIWLDELLCRPELAPLVEKMRARTPQWFIDQADAAARDTVRGADALAESYGTAPGRILPADLPDWLRLGMLQTVAEWITGSARTCLHNPDAWHPQPVAAAAWKPGLIVCAPCGFLLSVGHGTVRDRTCDGCGHVCAGVDKGDPIYPSAVTYGPVTYMVGTCTPCRFSFAEVGVSPG